jgi:hypothetical protein
MIKQRKLSKKINYYFSYIYERSALCLLLYALFALIITIPIYAANTIPFVSLYIAVSVGMVAIILVIAFFMYLYSLLGRLLKVS